MTIPEYQTLMLPLLELASDGEEHRVSEAVESLADRFQLTVEERETLLPSGHQTTIANRVGWTKTYLAKAGLLEAAKRGVFRISPRGHELLARHPDRIDKKMLEQFPEFQEFQLRASSEDRAQPTAAESNTSSATPEELMEEGYQRLTARLAEELLERLHAVSPARFETIVLDLLLAMGYGGSRPDAGRALGRSGDGGIDGLINEDPLGLDVVYLQAKRWEGVVGRPVVQGFVGSLEGNRARKGVLITTSTFSGEAVQYIGMIDKRVVLIDGRRLAQLMVDHGVGVTTGQTYAVKRLDLDYFDDESA
ncbi:MAG TPA: restriction endonuclease [Dehalococcoidia bacterium]|nr:restriction endonuclease [Dehalococcoidia bacterium]